MSARRRRLGDRPVPCRSAQQGPSRALVDRVSRAVLAGAVLRSTGRLTDEDRAAIDVLARVWAVLAPVSRSIASLPEGAYEAACAVFSPIESTLELVTGLVERGGRSG